MADVAHEVLCAHLYRETGKGSSDVCCWWGYIVDVAQMTPSFRSGGVVGTVLLNTNSKPH
jgi:hypothetical protein